MELENLMLNEVGESHNENYCVFLRVWYLGGGEEIKAEGWLGTQGGLI